MNANGAKQKKRREEKKYAEETKPPIDFPSFLLSLALAILHFCRWITKIYCFRARELQSDNKCQEFFVVAVFFSLTLDNCFCFVLPFFFRFEMSYISGVRT